MNRQRQIFDQVKARLVASGCLRAAQAEAAGCPDDPQEIPASLMRMGVAADKLLAALSEVLDMPIYDADEHGDAREQAPDGSWLLAGGVFFVGNPFKIPSLRAILPRLETAVTGVRYGLLPIEEQAAEDQAGDDDGERLTKARAKVRQWLRDALRGKASDVHLCPRDAKTIAIKHRVDSRLRLVSEWKASPELEYKHICNVLLTLAGKNSGIFGQLVDGSIRQKIGGRAVEIRLSMRPVALADGAAPAFFLRLPGGAGRRDLRLAALGVLPQQLAKLARLADCGGGFSVMTGPTGSGKTTTLYALLREVQIRYPQRSIQTLEDPVERHLEGIEQTQINEKSLTFADGLRSLMRTDVDVILLGEVRDQKTAALCISACLTGHYLMTTLHAPTALGAVDRLMDLGVDLRLLASWLRFASAQRLARRVCPHCSRKVVLGERYHRRDGSILRDDEVIAVADARGCAKCAHGYSGLVLLLEVVEVTDAMRPLIRGGGSICELEQCARAAGDVLFAEYAERVIRDGDTTFEAAAEACGVALAVAKDSQSDKPEPTWEKTPCPTENPKNAPSAALH